MKISLLIVATNKYIDFVSPLISSARKFFMLGHEVSFHVFTDRHYVTSADVFRHEVCHLPYPLPTLLRFHFFERYSDMLLDSDYIFYIDADCLFKSDVSDDILSERVGVQHCGFTKTRGPYEKRRTSSSYVSKDRGSYYFGGGFWGFSKNQFFRFNTMAKKMVDSDLKKGIIPVWHDESVLNRFFIDNPPSMVLNPEYHYPESNEEYYKELWGGQEFRCRVLLLDKEHKEVRSC